MSNDGMSTECVTKLPWDSKHFGIEIARVNGNRLSESLVSEIEEWLAANPVDCLYFSAALEANTLRYAAELGFRFIDARVTLETAPRLTEPAKGIRVATHEDLPDLCRIASESHHDSRFYADGRFDRNACDKLYRIWISNGLSDENGVVFVPDMEGKAAGYISIHAKDGAGQISLLAVDTPFRRFHLGTELIRAANAWFLAQGVSRIEVPTQAGNIPAIRLYEKSGFLVWKVEPWYHRWTVEQR
jgi:dTDP-4-amino-4,6-dideoxy-D-galactose acyltransferase